ncbi:MAG: LysM peptidoglycan-binding domain-containing protein [bacterium]|nr:LysM peptidoglycan-binding domain-containing protein [bacterium]MDE0131879.1 LysM peptidoglycan-binding domain-containing protein [bacterium]MDE0501864.1 LysM peptidoglycan-binding domain-containing protein [bacterium]
MRSTTADPQAGLRALFLGLLVVIFAGALLLLFEGEAVGASGQQEMEAVVVSPGETLWEIADRFSPESVDLRVVVRELVELNGLESKVLRPGQVLQVPTARF